MKKFFFDTFVPVTGISKGKPTKSTFYAKRGFGRILDIDDEDLEAKATSVTVCLIRNCHKKINMDAFTMEKPMELCGNQGFTTLRQRPQQSTQN